MKVTFNYLKEKKSLEIKWNKKEKLLNISEDEDLDLNDLYDDIINKINEVEIIPFKKEEDDGSIYFKACNAIYKAISCEINDIKDDKKKNFEFTEE